MLRSSSSREREPTVRSVKPIFSVLIVNYNAGDLLQSAINSLKNQTFEDFEAVIVDNASTDDSMARIPNHDPRLRVEMADTNLGFASANNLGAELNVPSL